MTRYKKVSAGQGDDYTTGFLLDHLYFEDNYRLIAVCLSKRKALNAVPRPIKQIVSQEIAGGADNTKIRLLHYSWKFKWNSLRILQKNSESFVRICTWLNAIK